MFTLPPSDEPAQAKPCSVPCWDLLQTSVQGKVEFPLPLRHMFFSLFSKSDTGVGTTAWSIPTPLRPDLPRQSLSIPVDQDPGGGLCSRWVKHSVCALLAVTVHLKQGNKPWLPHAASYTLLNTGDEARREILSKFPL